MKEVIQFIQDYWQYISVAIIFIFEIILMIIKKKPKTQVFDGSIYSQVIEWIKEAETLFGPGNGDTKFTYVLGKYMSIRPTLSEEEATAVLDIIVDDVLSTPTKKGGHGREQIK